MGQISFNTRVIGPYIPLCSENSVYQFMNTIQFYNTFHSQPSIICLWLHDSYEVKKQAKSDYCLLLSEKLLYISM